MIATKRSRDDRKGWINGPLWCRILARGQRGSQWAVRCSRRRHSLYSARENAWPRCHAENPGYRR